MKHQSSDYNLWEENENSFKIFCRSKVMLRARLIDWIYWLLKHHVVCKYVYHYGDIKLRILLKSKKFQSMKGWDWRFLNKTVSHNYHSWCDDIEAQAIKMLILIHLIWSNYMEPASFAVLIEQMLIYWQNYFRENF